jgi:hypothetical protein
MIDGYISLIILVIIIVIITIYIFSRKHLMLTFKDKNVDSVKLKAIELLKSKGYNVKEKKEKIYVELDYLTSTGLVFERNGLDVELYYLLTSTKKTWALMIAGLLTAGILSVIIVRSSGWKSHQFVKFEILPLLKKGIKGKHIENVIGNWI